MNNIEIYKNSEGKEIKVFAFTKDFFNKHYDFYEKMSEGLRTPHEGDLIQINPEPLGLEFGVVILLQYKCYKAIIKIHNYNEQNHNFKQIYEKSFKVDDSIIVAEGKIFNNMVNKMQL